MPYVRTVLLSAHSSYIVLIFEKIEQSLKTVNNASKNQVLIVSRILKVALSSAPNGAGR